MLWALEKAGLLATGILTLNLSVGTILYAGWVLIRPSRRSESPEAAAMPR